ERESADDQLLAGMFALGPFDRCEDVTLLAFAFVVFAGARTDAAKIESQRCHVRVLQSARGAEHDLVVQRATAERMRMTDDRDADRILKLAVQRLEPSRASVDIDVAQRLWIHARFTRMRSPPSF